MTNLSLDPLTWIIYQGNLSTRCPPSPTHASTKHVLKSPSHQHTITRYVHVPYHVPTMYHASTMHINTCTMYHTMHQPCTSHQPYHTMYHNIYQTSNTNGVPQPSTIITKRCILSMCYHIPSVYLNNVSISMVDL
jgi:hypothetical protein